MPDSFKHTVPTIGAGQATYEQCWLASYKMMLKFMKRSENEVEDNLRAAAIDINDAKENGLLDTLYKKSADALGMTALAGSPFNDEPSWYDVGLSDGAEAFIAELEKGPLWVSRYIKKGSYHIVVAVGYNDSESRIIYNNPFPGPTNAVELELKANLFVKFITNARGSVQGKK
jgi:Papain-like cysteine protease AvrRpt2